MGQPIDTSRSWRPIPPIQNNEIDGSNANNLFVVVSDERLYAARGGGLCKLFICNLFFFSNLNRKFFIVLLFFLLILADGEIAALVIGLFIALVIAIAIVTFLVIKLRRKRQKQREKS